MNRSDEDYRFDLRNVFKRRDFWANIVFCCIVFAICGVSGLIYSVNWKLGVGLLCFIGLLIFNYHRLDLAMLAVFFFIPFDRLARVGPESSITAAKIMIATIIIVFIARILITKETAPVERLRGNYFFLLLVLFLIFSFVSIINSHHDENFWRQLIRRVNVVVLFWLIINIVDNKNLLLRALKVILVAYIAIGFIGIYEIWSGDSVLKTFWGEEDTELEYILKGGEGRITGTGGDPDFHAIAVILPSLIAGFFFSVSKSKFFRLMLCFFLCLMFVNMLGTGSRGGLLSVLIGFAFLLFFSKAKYKYAVGITAALIVVAFIVMLNLANTKLPTERYTGGGTKSIVYRIGWMGMAFSMIKEHPFFGIGTGNFPGEYNRHISGVATVPREPHWTHNSFLQMWAENGIFGFFVYVAMYVVSAMMMWMVIRKSRDPTTRALGVLLLAVLIAYFFFAGTSNIIENENYWIVFAFSYVVYNFFVIETREEEKTLGQ